MKLTAAVNEMPVWQTNDLCSTRRNYQIHMQKLFLDLNDESSKAVIREYRDQGLPACLIVQKDIHFFDNHVKGQQQSFLRFMVLGAVAYYQQKNIEIPASMGVHQRLQTVDKPGAVQDYVLTHLHISDGTKLLLKTIRHHFRETTKIDKINLTDNDFDALLRNATLLMGPEWTRQVEYYNMRADGDKGMGYTNIKLLHPVVGIQKFTKITPRHPRKVDKVALVKH